VRCGIDCLGFSFEGASDVFQLIGKLEARDALCEAKAPLGFTTQSIRGPRWFAVERGGSAR
jgi:hypothetical protein